MRVSVCDRPAGDTHSAAGAFSGDGTVPYGCVLRDAADDGHTNDSKTAMGMTERREAPPEGGCGGHLERMVSARTAAARVAV